MIRLGFYVDVAKLKKNTMDPIDIQSPRLFRMIHGKCAVVMVISVSFIEVLCAEIVRSDRSWSTRDK